MADKYFIRYICDGSPVMDVVDIAEIAKLVGFSDFNECTDFSVWRYNEGLIGLNKIESLQIHHEHKSGSVWITDWYGNYIEGSMYPSH